MGCHSRTLRQQSEILRFKRFLCNDDKLYQNKIKIENRQVATTSKTI